MLLFTLEILILQDLIQNYGIILILQKIEQIDKIRNFGRNRPVRPRPDGRQPDNFIWPWPENNNYIKILKNIFKKIYLKNMFKFLILI